MLAQQRLQSFGLRLRTRANGNVQTFEIATLAQPGLNLAKSQPARHPNAVPAGTACESAKASQLIS
jgi:hypothetical protein